MRYLLVAVPLAVVAALVACGSSDEASASSADGGASSGGSSGAASSSGTTSGSSGTASSSGGSSSGDAATDGGDAGDGGSDGGDGGGAVTCASFCAAMQTTCNGDNEQYDDVNDCLTECAQWAVGTSSDQTGDTLHCRENHRKLSVADPDVHCEHAGPNGGGVCED